MSDDLTRRVTDLELRWMEQQDVVEQLSELIRQQSDEITELKLALKHLRDNVSALGEGFQVYVNGQVQSIGGTSASSPTFAAIVSLPNEARFKAGKPAMGFLNPFLYANPDAFFDVVEGTNAEGRGPFTSPYGYHAAPGWDAATGLGTPHFNKLLTAAMKATEPATVEEVA